ncbi:MAG: hypothetical protein QT10_C0001G0119 [archaeon GW2011_AR19]|nr:MAG: hypothetical protein QT10_C0001G0119 [archaeon GW2011_AR19]
MEIKINNFIVADSNVCGGKPVFKGTRIMVWQILELLGSGVSIDEILKNYFPQLTKKAILSVLNYASKVMEEEKCVSLN